ncbi:hypothetical protein ASPCAL11797 [Aspergillus calidoustus]|uniref:Uncharacterized protein n=2 Tax=Aspergillus subgen. Nidulantes TaxID=2720870 RepID=A0A0U5CEX9_ASPCI|nr:hypothetical protein ASPCAL11797 [Aspergillus calidoustus]
MGEISEDMEANDGKHAKEPSFVLERGRGSIPYTRNKAIDVPYHLVEMRHALAARTTTSTRLPHYTIVTLYDDRSSYSEVGRDAEFASKSRTKKLRFSRCGSLTGVAVFLAEVSLCLEIIARSWSRGLDTLDKFFSMSLEQLTPYKTQDLMFDGDDFFKSEQYFTILQALRLCRNYVNDTIRDVRNIPNIIHDELDPTLEGLAENDLAEKLLELQRLDTILSRLVSDCEALFEPLLDRIERINEEMKSLRDGLFNATSVREASKGTSLAENSALQNRYILVFTIATIFYLPMGFVTSFYGMHLFDPDDVSSKSRIPFIITFVLISVGTYVCAAGGLWLVRYREVAKKLFSGWRDRSDSAV